MSRKKSEELKEPVVTEAIEAINDATRALDDIMTTVEEGDAQLGELEQLSNDFGSRIGNMLNSLQKVDDNSLLDSLVEKSVEKEQESILDIHGTKVKYRKHIDRMEFYAAIQLMIGIMEGHKNKVGYRDFSILIDELEFMFFASFYTEIGFSRDIDKYMIIHNLFLSSGAKQELYSQIQGDVEIARRIFERFYQAWANESLAMASFVLNAGTAQNVLSQKVMDLIDDEAIVSQLIESPDIQTALISSIAAGMKQEGDTLKDEGVKPEPVVQGMSFQKVDITSKPQLKVLKGEKRD